MKKDMRDIEEIFNKLFDSNPKLKEEMEQDEKWRQQRQEFYIKTGMSENDAKIYAWVDYWKMAKERDGVKFSINKLS